eukprot:gene26200-biopygen14861
MSCHTRKSSVVGKEASSPGSDGGGGGLGDPLASAFNGKADAGREVPRSDSLGTRSN